MLPTTLAQFIGVFNILVGLMLTASILLLGTGIIMWFARLGTTFTYRDRAIEVMMWAVSVLFTLVVMVSIVRFVQNKTETAVFILGFIIIAAVAYFIITSLMEGGGEKKDDEKHAA